MELAKAIATLSQITANLANRQQRFETNILTFIRQPLQKQIVTTNRSIENRNRNLIKQNFKKMGQETPLNNNKLITMIKLTSRQQGNTTKLKIRSAQPWLRIYNYIRTFGKNTINIMKIRYLSIDYLPFRKYPNGIFKLYLTIIFGIFIIAKLFVLMGIFNTNQPWINQLQLKKNNSFTTKIKEKKRRGKDTTSKYLLDKSQESDDIWKYKTTISVIIQNSSHLTTDQHLNIQQ